MSTPAAPHRPRGADQGNPPARPSAGVNAVKIPCGANQADGVIHHQLVGGEIGRQTLQTLHMVTGEHRRQVIDLQLFTHLP